MAFGAIDLAVCPDDQAVEIVDQLLIPRLRPSYGEVRSGGAIKRAKFPDLHLCKAAEPRATKQ